MDYSQFLHMREELSLVVVLLLLFLADLFMSPDAHKNDGKARLNTMLPVILMAVHTAINLIPGTAADVFGGMYHYVPMHTVVKSILNIGTLIVFLMAHEWMKREDTALLSTNTATILPKPVPSISLRHFSPVRCCCSACQ